MSSKSALFLFVYGFLLVLLVLARPLLPIDETRYLAVAWEMHLSGDAFHLTRNFESYAHKPPLLFWLINVMWAFTGVSELPARLVGPICAVCVVAATGAVARRLWPHDEEIAFRAMVASASFPVFMAYSSATMFDALLTLPVLGGIAVLWRIGQGGAATRHWFALGLVLGAGILAKGPVILVHVLPALLTMKLWAASPPARGEAVRGTALAIVVAVGVAALWLVPALATGDADFRRELLWTQTAARMTGELGHGRPFWFLLALTPLMVWPWFWSWRLWRALRGMIHSDGGLRLCAIWAVGGLLVLSVVGGKQLHYLLPEVPALGLIAARGSLACWKRRGGSIAPLALFALALLLLVVALKGADDLTGASVLLSPGQAATLAGLFASLGLLGLALPVGPGHVVMGLGVTLVLHLGFLLGGLSARFDTQSIADVIAARSEQGVALFATPDNADFNFKARLTRPIATPETVAELADWLRSHPDGWVLGPVEQISVDAPAREIWTYRDRTIGLWQAGDLKLIAAP